MLIRLTAAAATLLAASLAGCGEGDAPSESVGTTTTEPALTACVFPNDDEPPEPSNHIRVANTDCETARKLWAVGPSFGDLKPHRPVFANGDPVVPGDWICQGRDDPDAFHVSCRDGDQRVEYDIY